MRTWFHIVHRDTYGRHTASSSPVVGHTAASALLGTLKTIVTTMVPRK
jgi:hypothetical protein